MIPQADAPLPNRESRRRARPRAGGSLMRQLRVPRDTMVTQINIEPDSAGQHGARGPAITAAAQVMFSAGQAVSRKRVRMPTQPWQAEVWELRRNTPELRFCGDRVSRAASGCRFFIGKKAGPDEEPTPISGDATLEALSKSMFGTAGATQAAVFRAAQHITFAGDALLVVTDNGPKGDGNPQDGNPVQGGHTWQSYSTTELTGLSGGGQKPKINDGINQRELDLDNEIVVRCYNPDPERGAFADSPSRAVMPLARELIGLTKYVSAQIDSRLAGAGLLLVPSGIRPMGNQIDAVDPDTGLPLSFADQLSEAMIVPVEDRDSAASLVPFIAEVDKDLLALIQHIKFSSELDPQLKDLREEAIRRIGLGMDSDPAVLLGMSGANHWSAWAVSEDEVKLAVSPVCATICHALTTGWLRPILDHLGASDPDDIVVWFDATPLQLRPDRSKDAQTLFDKDELSAVAMRRESGFAETDAPSAEDKKIALLTRIAIGAPTLAPIIFPLLGIEIPDAAKESGAEVNAAAGGTDPTSADTPPDKTPPPPPPPPTDGRGAPGTGDDPPPAAGGGAPGAPA